MSTLTKITDVAQMEERPPEPTLPPGYLDRQNLQTIAADQNLGPLAKEAEQMLLVLRTPERLSALSMPSITMVSWNGQNRTYAAKTHAAFFKAVGHYAEDATPAIASWNVKRMSTGTDRLARRMRAFAEQIQLRTVGIAYNGAGRIIQYMAEPAAADVMSGPNHANVFESMGITVAQNANLGKVLKRLRAMGTGGDAALFHPEASHVDLETGWGVFNLPGQQITFKLVDDANGGITNSGGMHCRYATALKICEAFTATPPDDLSRIQPWLTTDQGQVKGMIVIDENAPLPEGADMLVARDCLVQDIAASVTTGKMNFWAHTKGTEVLEVEGLQMAPNFLIHTGAQQLAEHQAEIGDHVMAEIASDIRTGQAFERLTPESVAKRQERALRVSLDGKELRMPDAERADRLSEQLGLAGPWASAEIMREATLKIRKMAAFGNKQSNKGLPGCFAIGFKSMATDESLFPDGIMDDTARILWKQACGKDKSTPNGVAVNANTFSVITPSMEGHDHDDSTYNFLFPGDLFQIRTPSTFESGAMLSLSHDDYHQLAGMGLKRFTRSGPGKQHPDLHAMDPVHPAVLYEEGHIKWNRDPWQMLNIVQPHLENVAAIGMIALLAAALIHSGNFRPLEHLVSNSDVIDRVHKMDGNPWPAYEGLLEAICRCVRQGDMFEPNTWAAIADRVEARYLEMTEDDGTPYVSEINRETFRIGDIVMLSSNEGHESLIQAREDLLLRLERFTARLNAYANGSHHWLVEKHPMAIRHIAEQLVEQASGEWSYHFRANATDDGARSRVGQMALMAYEEARATMGDEYQMGSFSACVAQAQAVQRNRFPVNADEDHKSLSLSLLGDLPWVEQICFWAFPKSGMRAKPTWRTRIRPYGNQQTVPNPEIEYSVTRNELSHILLIEGDWSEGNAKRVVGQLGPEGNELVGLRSIKFLGEIPKTGVDGEVEQAVFLLEVPERHALRVESSI